MIPEKIKTIRMFLGISETQVSSLIYTNNYKYKRSENDVNYISSDMLLLLSVIYRVPLEKLLLDNYTKEDILKNGYLESLKILSKEQIEESLKDNVCSYFVKKRKKANYTTINMILKNEKRFFATKLKEIRLSKQLNTIDISKILEMEISEYIVFESGRILPEPLQLIRLINVLNVPIADLISFRPQNDRH